MNDDTVKVHCCGCDRELSIARIGYTVCLCGVRHYLVTEGAID